MKRYPSNKPIILIISNESSFSFGIKNILAEKCCLHLAFTLQDGARTSTLLNPDLALLDSRLLEREGESQQALPSFGADTAIIAETGSNSRSAFELIRTVSLCSAPDPARNGDGLLAVVAQALSAACPSKMDSRGIRERIVGQSREMQCVWEQVKSFAPTDLPILLQGETGTGKELFAKAIHQRSTYRHGSLVTIDCTTLPDELFESELFGHKKGSFTGAHKDKPGRILEAHQGTLFLDELSALSLSGQAKLLRLVDERRFAPLGHVGARQDCLDTRFISATNIPLDKAILRGDFRMDLYYRLNGVTIDLPPLRDRGSDVELLSEYFVDRYRQKYGRHHLELSGAAKEILCLYSWPGNIRELQQVLAAAVVVAKDQIMPCHLPIKCDKASTATMETHFSFRLGFRCNLESPLNLNHIKESAGREVERKVIQEVCKRKHLSQRELAKYLGIDPKTLRSRLRELEMDSGGKPPKSDDLLAADSLPLR